MIAALSYFYTNKNIGGFYFYGPNNQEEKQLISFDGKAFASNGEKYLEYLHKYKFGNNTLPVFVLVGDKTASSAEFLALALQRQLNITLIGTNSYGIATVNSAMMLPDNLGCYMLTIGYYLDQFNQPLISKKVVPDELSELKGKHLIDYCVEKLKKFSKELR